MNYDNTTVMSPTRSNPDAIDHTERSGPRDTSYGSGHDAPDDGLHLRDYLLVLYKRRWIAVTAFLLVVLSTAVYVLTVTPDYAAQVRILIENQNPKVLSFQEVLEQTQGANTNEYYQTQYKILESRGLARRTLDSLKLWAHPQFNAHRSEITSWLTSKKPLDAPGTDETSAQSVVIDRFLEDLTVAPLRNSRLVDVSFRSSDPAMAARVANALAKNYIAQNLEFKLLSTKDASDFLGERLAEQRKQVDASERALQQYREKSDAVSLEDRQNIVVQKLADLNAGVTKARTERMLKQAAYDQIRNVQDNRETLDTLPAIASNTFIQQQKGQLADLQRQRAQLSGKLGPKHPDMQKLALAIETAQTRIDAEISKLVESLRNDYQQAVAQEQSLSAALEQQKRDALDLNRKGIEYGQLSRDAAANRQMFDSLMLRLKETGVSGELKSSNIRVVDEAEVPRDPASPRKGADVFISVIAGLMIGLGCAFFVEYLDNCIKNPEEIKQHLGLPFLGMVPRLALEETGKAQKAMETSPLVNNGVPLNFVESFRTLGAKLLFSSAADGGRSIVITSTGPGEGKTMVASNIAMTLALAGQRILLIDADMRRPRVHKVFDKPQRPGLSNVLAGTCKDSESWHDTAVSGLWVLPAGDYPPNPPELLGSKRCQDLIASLHAKFDWIIIDTPPVMAVTDSSIVSHWATGVVFVVGSEMTKRDAALRAVEQLDDARARFAGAVLNRVDLQHNSYYYSQYYRREYSEYYREGAGT